MNKLFALTVGVFSCVCVCAQRPARTSQFLQANAKDCIQIPFAIGTDISTCKIPEAPVRWGMDVAWNDKNNVQRGTNFIGKDILSEGIGRVSFQPSDLVDENGNLSAAQQNTLQKRINNILLTGVRTINLNCDHEVLMNKEAFPNCDQNYANYNHKPAEWVRVIKATMKYCQSKGLTVVSVSPFNEPDFTNWKEGTVAEFKEIARLITEDPDFEGVRVCAGNTLNCDEALKWYNGVKPYVSEGNTHQLAGSFANYAKFWQTVRADGNVATADELHNTMEAFVGVHYGMQNGIWWGFDAAGRGEYCKASATGKEIGYGENRNTWSAGAVYKRPDGRVDAFLGTSERQASNSTMELISTDRPTYFNGFGPMYNYSVFLPGGNGYQNGQSNAEYMVQMQYGEDVPYEPLFNDSAYVIVNSNSMKAITAYQGNYGGGGIVQGSMHFKGYAYDYQKWIVQNVPSNVGGEFSFFYLRALADQFSYIDVRDFSNAAGAQLLACRGNKGTNEQWFTEYAGNGEWYIRCRQSGLYLDIEGGSTTANKALIQNTFTGSKSQRWRFVPTSVTKFETVAPAAPSDLKAERLTASVHLTWTANVEADMREYMVKRCEKGTNDWAVVGRMLTTPDFVDNDVVADKQYEYSVIAIDQMLNASEPALVAVTGNAPRGLVARYSFEKNLEDATENYLDGASAKAPSYQTLSPKDGANRIYVGVTNNDFVQIPAGAVRSKQLTVATWVYCTTSSSWQRIFDFGNNTNQYMFLTPNNGSELRFGIKNNGDEQVLGTGAKLSTSMWHHVAVSIGDEKVSIYVDGQLKAETTDITLRPTDVMPVQNYIARSQFSSDPVLKGYVDDFRIYNYELSADEVAAVMNGEEVSGITGVSRAENVENAAVYSLDGRRIAAPQKGVNIISGKKIIKK